MRCIFLDIASHSGIVAMVREKEVVASREVSTRIRDHELIPLVEGLLEEVEWKYEDLTHVACVVGPGGFTSLRVAVSFANTLIDQLEILGVGIHLSEVYFARDSGSACLPARQGIRNQDVFWLHATKRDSLFVKGGEWTEPTLVTLEEFKEKVPQEAQWMGELLDEQLEELASKQLVQAELKPVAKVLPQFISQLKFTSKPLEPWYGRTG
ncbi:tRNA (adenosine(37)-N6)-threonylcarbamoyltransferase complex dimerization subunit type 1 TsaB [Patescibacteria group bacterium]|nr:tRNA (adenosine(37)-N6)-threonylcarbamoyltransferase complex dimerization subunit type 1 TsaB [Patescibacteria group bacterium]MBU2259587.1 tRNA (adenosine(37)-N6)-threonylcarbamoyltransferase complex dimerization subunit type 1 TsaB [Patescibacteria group bacterium]